nr:class I SAM-dependent DNA methyltransferase [Tardiphaga sp. vice352]
MLQRALQKPSLAQKYFNSLFEAMESGGEFDLTEIAHFNGGLFDGRKSIPMDADDLKLLVEASSLDWSLIDPTIFGTLFERFLDPTKRSQIGAHYTDPEKIMQIIEPVVLRPLREEWEAVRSTIKPLTDKASGIKPTSQSPGDRRVADNAARKLRSEATLKRDSFLARLSDVRVLDPACGSGNFLYLALQGIKDLENRIVLECEAMDLPPKILSIGPEILAGIEINFFAAELARTTIWIGDIQWRRRNGIYSEPPPILRKLDSIECRNALIAVTNGNSGEASWPEAEFIIGNPPFLGAKKFLGALGDDASQTLRGTFEGRIPAFSDLVCWWFEKAKSQVLTGQSKRVGFVATNKIRNGASRIVLDNISNQLAIFEAWSDEKWIVDGAAVRVSIVCFGKAADSPRLDGHPVVSISSALTPMTTGVISPQKLKENAECAFIGVQLNGEFDINETVALSFLTAPLNPNGESNTKVVRPLISGRDIMRDRRARWLIDFGTELSEPASALFEMPFEWVKKRVKAERDTQKRASRKRYWWRFGETMPKMRRKTSALTRYMATSLSSRHRAFVWIPHPTLVDSTCVVIAKDDDATFGILHSRFHLNWAREQGNWLGVGNDSRYTPTTTFETFPFPEGFAPADKPEMRNATHHSRISEAGRRLDRERNAWLYPPNLVELVPSIDPAYPARLLPKNAEAAETLKLRTLTNLYSQKPQWLLNAHTQIDNAVAAAYGWAADLPDNESFEHLLQLNSSRANN